MKIRNAIVLSLLILVGCVSKKSTLDVKHISNNRKVVLSYDRDKDMFLRIQIPITFTIENNCETDAYLYSIKYNYAFGKSGLVSPFYEIIDNNKIKQSFSSRKSLKDEKLYTFLIYSQHLIKNDSISQLNLSDYKGIVEGKFDTIITVEAFKEKNGMYYKHIVKNDSINIKYKLGETMKTQKIPVLQ